MKLVKYEDVPELCDQLLEEVEKAGITIQVMKNDRPMLQIVPVDEKTKAIFAAKRRR